MATPAPPAPAYGPPGSYQPPPPGYYGGGAAVSAGAPTDQMAIWSIVLAGLGVFGLCCIGVGGIIGGGIAFFLGGSSLTRIKASNGTVGGTGLAQAGRWGGLGVAIFGFLILLVYIVAVVMSKPTGA